MGSSFSSVVTVRTGQYEPSRLRPADFSHSIPRRPLEPAGGADVFPASWREGAGKLSGGIQGSHDHPCEPPLSPGPGNPLPPHKGFPPPATLSPVVAGALAVPVSPVTALPLSAPEKFSGETGKCCAFIVDCEMYYELRPSAFPTERSKVAFMVSHLTGRAKAWATSEWSRESSICNSLDEFIEALRGAFDPTSSDREKACALSNIRQGTDSVCDYAIRFRTLATDSGWNSTALYDVFLKGLSDQIQDLLVPLDLPSSLDSIITLALELTIVYRSVDGTATKHHLPTIVVGPMLHRLRPLGSVRRTFPHQLLGRRHPLRRRNPCSWDKPNCPQRSVVVAYRKDGASIVGSKVTSSPCAQQKGRLASRQKGTGELPLNSLLDP